MIHTLALYTNKLLIATAMHYGIDNNLPVGRRNSFLKKMFIPSISDMGSDFFAKIREYSNFVLNLSCSAFYLQRRFFDSLTDPERRSGNVSVLDTRSGLRSLGWALTQRDRGRLSCTRGGSTTTTPPLSLHDTVLLSRSLSFRYLRAYIPPARSPGQPSPPRTMTEAPRCVSAKVW